MIVKSTLPDGVVCLWERHPDHPGGEVFIANHKEHRVALTQAVQSRLKLGWLVEVKEPEPEPPAAEPEPKPKRRR